MNEPSKELTLAEAAKVDQTMRVVASAIQVSLGVTQLAPEFTERRDELAVTVLSFKTPPNNEEEQEELLKVKRQCTKLRTELTRNADAFKAPLNAARTTIIDLEKQGSESLKKLEGHIDGLVSNFQQRLLRERQDAEAAALEEQRRIQKEAAEAQRIAQEAEKARVAAEEAQRKALELQGQEKAKAEQEAERLREEAERLEAEAFQHELDAESAMVPAVPVSEGPTAKEFKDFVILGDNDESRKANIIRLLIKHPELFSFNYNTGTPRSYSLSLRVRDLTDRLNGKPPAPEITSAPGIEIQKRLSTLR